MKKTLSLALFLFLSLLNLRAEILEYNYKGVVTYIGGGQQGVASYSGIMLYDTATTNLTFVAWNAKKHYRISSSTNYHMVFVEGPKATTYTLLVFSGAAKDSQGSYYFDHFMLKGVNKSLTIGAGKTFSFAPVLTGINNRDLGLTAGAETLQTSNESFTFNAKRTMADNGNSLSREDIALNLGAWLESLGYLRVD